MTKKPLSGKGEKPKTAGLKHENEELRQKVRELEETLDAIRTGEVDAIVVSKGDTRQVYTLEGADKPYRTLVENIREGALTLSSNGMILYTNSRFAEMVHRPADKIPGTSILDYICPEHRTEIAGLMKEILIKSCRTRLRLRQGEKGSLPVLISMNPLDHGDNTKISMVITDRRKDEERIQLQARMLDAVGDAVIAADTHNKVIYWNNAATRTYGWTPEEAVGRDLSDVATPDLTKDEAREMAARLAMGEPWAGEYIVRHRDGHEFPIYASDAPVFDDNGNLLAIIGASHDISERKRAESELNRRHAELNIAYEELTATQEELHQNVDELTRRERQLKEALAEKEILLSEIHHRVKNNLSAFISLLSLEGGYDSTPAGLAIRKDLQNRARSMALIHEILYRTQNFSRVDMQIYLSSLAEQVVSSYETSRSIRIVVNARGISLDLMKATPTGLIVNELVTNALKYAWPLGFDCKKTRGNTPVIEILLSGAEDGYTLTVRDNGVGLPAEIDPAQTKTLGLKLVNFLARHQLQAEISILRRAGTEFIFLLNERQ